MKWFGKGVSISHQTHQLYGQKNKIKIVLNVILKNVHKNTVKETIFMVHILPSHKQVNILLTQWISPHTMQCIYLRHSNSPTAPTYKHAHKYKIPPQIAFFALQSSPRPWAAHHHWQRTQTLTNCISKHDSHAFGAKINAALKKRTTKHVLIFVFENYKVKERRKLIWSAPNGLFLFCLFILFYLPSFHNTDDFHAIVLYFLS